MDNLRETLGKRVRAFREARNWSQEQLGKAAGLGGKYIGMIERAEKAASFVAIEKLASVFGVECYELLVPMNRRADSVQRHVKSILSQPGRIDTSNVEEFLKVLTIALRKLDRQSK